MPEVAERFTGLDTLVSDAVINIQPHPRILTVLGDIEFKPWQCLAELIDNAFDDFQVSGSAAARPTVTISLPGADSEPRLAEVWVKDNGRGMDVPALNNAIRAGWTSNARHGSLGLFGMGFNIATARLGKIITIRTSRAGDPFWSVVTLDLPRLSRGANYDVPIEYAEKDDPGDHGTQIVVRDLRQELWRVLSRQQDKIRETLGDVYSYLLREKDFVITVNNQRVRPRRPCVWRADRFVTRKSVNIPAIMEVNRELPALKACMDCGEWQALDSVECDACQGGRLEARERRIWGWIGVQRYTHQSFFGLDFLRNGRKILIQDKRVFEWNDPDGIAASEAEYPIDNLRGEGRLVGEIHCDHVAVNYQKDAFEYDSVEWRSVVRAIRGEAPLRPNIARDRGYDENLSPLARLYSGYRTDKPGLKYLYVGDGDRAKMGQWVRRFHDGSPDYQDDEKWYQAVYEYDNPPVPDPEPDDLDVFDEMGLGGPEDTPPTPTSGTGAGGKVAPPPPPLAEPEETLDQRLNRYREGSRPIAGLDARFEATDLGHVELSAWAVSDHAVCDVRGTPVPVWVHSTRGSRAEAFVDVRHPLFVDYGADIREIALAEVAEFLRYRTPASYHPPLSAVLADVKARAQDQKVTPGALGERANHLLSRLRDSMLPEIKGAPLGYWDLLAPNEHSETESRFVIEAGDTDWQFVIESGEFIRYAPATAVVRLLERRPDAFLDGRVFRRPYVSLTDEATRSLVVSRLAGFVSDLALMERHSKLSRDELLRLRLTCDLLERDLADGD